jgi:hypothetical protein
MNCFFTFRHFPVFRFGYELLEALNPARARVQDFLAGGPVAGSAPTLSAHLAADIAALWADPALGKAYDRRSEFQVQQTNGYALPRKGSSLTERLPLYMSFRGVGKFENIPIALHNTEQKG